MEITPKPYLSLFIPTPTMPKADLTALPTGERNVLHMLAVRLLCAVGSKHTYAETVVTVICEETAFTAKGRTVLYDGWKAVDSAFRASLKNKPEEDVGADDSKALPEPTEGQTFPAVSASIREGFTSPPKAYTEDTLLSAMECAGAEDMPDNRVPTEPKGSVGEGEATEKSGCSSQDGRSETEFAPTQRRGLGTSATRAGVIERLVKSGFIERRKKNLFPTGKAVNLIMILPDRVKSPQLTAEWEYMLGQIERGERTADVFMADITAMTRELVETHSAPDEKCIALFAKKPEGDVVGPCPRCGGSVYENKKGFFCEHRACGFALWKNSKFFTAKRKELSRKTAAALLTEGRVFIPDLFSEKTGKTYGAAVVLDDTGKYMNFKLLFE